MSTLLFIVFIVLVCINIILYYNFRKQKERKIICAEAGPTKDISNNSTPHDYPITFFDEIMINGKKINEKEYIPIIVHGSCMEQRGIFSGDILYVKEIKALSNEEKEKIIKERDILLIYLSDKDIYKIREFEKVDAENKAKTFYYTTEGKNYSTNSHEFETIQGVVKYKLPA